MFANISLIEIVLGFEKFWFGTGGVGVGLILGIDGIGAVWLIDCVGSLLATGTTLSGMFSGFGLIWLLSTTSELFVVMLLVSTILSKLTSPFSSFPTSSPKAVFLTSIFWPSR